MKRGTDNRILQDPSRQDQGCNSLSSASDCWEYTKSWFKENAKIFSKNSTTQEIKTKIREKRKLIRKRKLQIRNLTND